MIIMIMCIMLCVKINVHMLTFQSYWYDHKAQYHIMGGGSVHK